MVILRAGGIVRLVVSEGRGWITGDRIVYEASTFSVEDAKTVAERYAKRLNSRANAR
jgi:hypothetical protein